MRFVLCIIAASLCDAPSRAQEPASGDNPFSPAVVAVDNSTAANQPVTGSVTFAFDGGTLRCTFGVSNRNERPHVTMIVHPSSFNAMAKRSGIAIKREGNKAIVIASTADRKFVQLTSSSVSGWSRARIAEMSGRKSSIAENSFVSAVVHALSNDLAVSLWASDAQDALESGHWSKLFDTRNPTATDDSIDDPFGGDPFK